MKAHTIVTGGVHDAGPVDEAVSLLTLRAAGSRTLTAQTVLLTPENPQQNLTSASAFYVYKDSILINDFLTDFLKTRGKPGDQNGSIIK